MRVLFVSDVYFPRVNGVSTSIRTFRADLAQAGVETLLVAPEYPGAPPDHEPGILRAPSGSVPRDPEDRRFLSRPLRKVMSAAYRTAQATAREHDVSVRMACFMIGIERVATAVRLRGFV